MKIKDSKNKAYVYLLRCGHLTKYGYSKHPKRRLRYWSKTLEMTFFLDYVVVSKKPTKLENDIKWFIYGNHRGSSYKNHFELAVYFHEELKEFIRNHPSFIEEVL